MLPPDLGKVVKQLHHIIPLDADGRVLSEVTLPADFTSEQAEHLCGVLRALALEIDSADRIVWR
jgi:hypothetical protein